MSAPRRYQRLPAAQHLNERILKLDAEAVQVLGRHRDLLAQRNGLAGEDHEKLAIDTDRQAQSIAVRNGRSAASVGQPAQDELAADRAALDSEIDALLAALSNIETEMELEFAAMVADDRASGRAGLASAEGKYRRAVDALVKARAEYVQIKALTHFLREASVGSNNQVLSQALRAADELIPMPVPAGFGIDPRYAPTMPFERHLAVLTAELTEEKS
jgi:hypothetical protein